MRGVWVGNEAAGEAGVVATVDAGVDTDDDATGEAAVEGDFVAAVEPGVEAVFEADLGDDVEAIDANANEAGDASRGIELGVASRDVASGGVGGGLGDIGGANNGNGNGAAVMLRGAASSRWSTSSIRAFLEFAPSSI